jgi:hypothetical protein
MAADASPKRLAKQDIVALLGATMGAAKAVDVIDKACKQLNLRLDSFDADQTMDLLDVVAASPGIVGTAARFAKARVIFMFT